MNVKIEHAAVFTFDLERLKNYYVKYFGASCNEKYTGSDGFSSYFLTFSSGARLEVMAHEKLLHADASLMTNGYAHLAFSVGSKENVDAITNKIVADGYELFSSPRTTGDGYYESSVADPDGNHIEITI